MPRYVRNYVPGATFFLTAVTYDRAPTLATAFARRCLGCALRQVRAKWPFDVEVIVLLPDHVHTVWTLPPGHADFSVRMGKVKELFTKAYVAQGGWTKSPTPSQAAHGYRGVWQPRFWEHTVRSEQDLNRCVDYVHWNPVKHGLVSRVADYPWSSFHRYVRLGRYAQNWGTVDPCPGLDMPE